MARRRTVQELLDIKAREPYRTRINIYYSRITSLKNAFGEGRHGEELLRYFPIGVIAAVESYFRAAYAEMIDVGEPFVSRIEPLIKDLRIDWRAVRAIEGKTVTSGEVISHSLPLASLGDIQRVMNHLLNADFLELLRKIPRNIDSSGGCDSFVLEDPDHCFRFVARAFELRHIFCHESATQVTVQDFDIRSCLESCECFLFATGALLSQGILDDTWGLSQAELTIRAGKKLQEAEAQLAEIEKKLDQEMPDQAMKKLLLASQEQWRQFAKTNIECRVFLWQGGSGYGMAYATYLEQITRQRIQDLQDQLSEFVSA